MASSPEYRRAPLLVIWAVLLSLLTAILGATPLRILRQLTGNGVYWLVGIVLVSTAVMVNWLPLALILGAHILLIGIYSEFEDREFTLRQSAFFAVFLTALLGFSSFYAWTAMVGKGWLAQLMASITPLIEFAKTKNADFFGELKAQDIVSQLPSAFFVFLVLSLASALILERRLGQWVNVKSRRTEKLSAFAAPDFFIWCFIVSLLGTFGQFGVPSLEFVSINVFNVTIVVYFFQGLAVLANYFATFQVSLFWRLLWVFFVVVQLPMLMSLLGVVDYWANFRKVFVKRAAQIKKKSVRD